MTPLNSVAPNSNIQQDQAHEQEQKLDVSKGQLIEFTANGNRVTGVIVKSGESSNPLYVECLSRSKYYGSNHSGKIIKIEYICYIFIHIGLPESLTRRIRQCDYLS